MTARSRFLGGETSPPPPSLSSTEPPGVERLDSDFIVILAALLCALICVLGLVAVARCAWIRRIAGGQWPSTSLPHAAANKGLKKKVLKSLPKLTYGVDSSAQAAKLSECAICLLEFAAGDEVRVLPQCGHGFHVVCIDTWLGSHSSCPSCRRILVVARCQNCGQFPSAACSSALPEPEPEPEPRASHVNILLP